MIFLLTINIARQILRFFLRVAYLASLFLVLLGMVPPSHLLRCQSTPLIKELIETEIMFVSS